MLKKVTHIGIAVDDLDKAITLYRDILQLPVGPRIRMEDRGYEMVFVDVGGTAKLELISSLRDDTTIAKYVASRGPGVHHICFEVDDIEQEITRLTEHGMTMVDKEPRPGADGGRIAFAHPKSTLGCLIEFKQPDSDY